MLLEVVPPLSTVPLHPCREAGQDHCSNYYTNSVMMRAPEVVSDEADAPAPRRTRESGKKRALPLGSRRGGLFDVRII